MMRLAEFGVFTGFAAVVHVGLFLQFGPSGAQSTGNAGQASISLVASNDAMADHVAAWTRPVEAAQQVHAALAAPAEPEPVFSTPQSGARPSKPVGPAPLTPALPHTAPRIDTETAKPATEWHAPKASSRPKTRTVKKTKPVAKTGKVAKPKTTSPARSQKAKGGQVGKTAGKAKVAQSASVSAATRRSLMANWGAAIRNRVERRKSYPAGTKVSGTTVLRITVSRAGRLKGVSIVRSSGSGRLDKAAVRAVQRARYPGAPKGLDAAQYKFNLPVTFQRK